MDAVEIDLMSYFAYFVVYNIKIEVIRASLNFTKTQLILGTINKNNIFINSL